MATSAGIPAEIAQLTISFPFADLEALDDVLVRRAGSVGCIILEARTAGEPLAGYLTGLLDLAHRHGALVALDEIGAALTQDDVDCTVAAVHQAAARYRLALEKEDPTPWMGGRPMRPVLRPFA